MSLNLHVFGLYPVYRAVDSAGNTLEFMLSAKCNGKAAVLFRKVQLSTLELHSDYGEQECCLPSGNQKP